jgi:hypothetical protein
VAQSIREKPKFGFFETAMAITMPVVTRTPYAVNQTIEGYSAFKVSGACLSGAKGAALVAHAREAAKKRGLEEAVRFTVVGSVQLFHKDVRHVQSVFSSGSHRHSLFDAVNDPTVATSKYDRECPGCGVFGPNCSIVVPHNNEGPMMHELCAQCHECYGVFKLVLHDLPGFYVASQVPRGVPVFENKSDATIDVARKLIFTDDTNDKSLANAFSLDYLVSATCSGKGIDGKPIVLTFSFWNDAVQDNFASFLNDVVP